MYVVFPPTIPLCIAHTHPQLTMALQQESLELFQEILKHQLTVDKLTDSISSTPSNGRSSDASDVLSNPDPAALTATLENYKVIRRREEMLRMP